MTSLRRSLGLLAVAWLALAVVALVTRPLIPFDETRYLAVAWDMWVRHDFLVPHLNGQPYSDKPPLLFWLFHAGWAVTGGGDTWPRLVGPLFGLAAALLLIPLGRRLWPDRPTVGHLAAMLLLGSLGWGVYGTFVLFDMLLSVGVLVAVLGVVQAWREGGWRGWILCGAGLGWGLLAKGPVALLHVLPVALLAPWWMREPRRWGPWYAGAGLAVLIGAAMVLAWAIPAAIAGGPAYADAIFLRQTAERMVNSFAHRRPVWWYLPILPLVAVPWVAWPAAWRAVQALRASLDEAPVRLCLAWAVTVAAAFSLISGKQVHYLLPTVPAVALLLARGLTGLDDSGPARTRGPAALLMAFGAAVSVAPHLALAVRPVPWIAAVPWWGGLPLLVAGGLLWMRGRSTATAAVPGVALGGIALPALLHLALMPAARPAYDTAPVATVLRGYEQRGYPVGHLGKYADQWTFTGGLRRPFEEVADTGAATRWKAAHERYVFISYARIEQGPAREAAGARCLPYRTRLVCLEVKD